MTISNAAGLIAGTSIGAESAAMATLASLSGIGAIPVAAIGAYGLYSAGKSMYRAARDIRANSDAHADKLMSGSKRR